MRSIGMLFILIVTAYTVAFSQRRCTGSTLCYACSTCSGCKNCNDYGGTCGICKPSGGRTKSRSYSGGSASGHNAGTYRYSTEKSTTIRQRPGFVEKKISKVNIAGRLCQILIMRDRYSRKMEVYKDVGYPNVSQSSISFKIVDESNNKVVFTNELIPGSAEGPFFEYRFIKPGADSLSSDGELYFYVTKSHGGSGYSTDYFWVDYKEGRVKFLPLFTIDELTYIIRNLYNQEFLVLKGLWNRYENETHFSPHRYVVMKYYYSNDQVTKEVLGTTKYKYASLDDGVDLPKMIKEISLNERGFLSSIDPAEYYDQ